MRGALFCATINPMEKQNIIRVKSLAWIEDQGWLFVVKMFDKVDKEDFYRPIGGRVEFGELTVETVKRETLEELNTAVEVIGDPQISENLFVCDGVKGHEIMYLYPCRFTDTRYYERRIYPLTEADGSLYDALWIPIKKFVDGTFCLVPESLLEWYQTKVKND